MDNNYSRQARDVYGDNLISKEHNEAGWISGLPCLFHNDENPSAGYNIHSDILHCFTCSKSWKLGIHNNIDLNTKIKLVLDRIGSLGKVAVEEDEKEFKLFYNKGDIPQKILDRGFTAEDLIEFECGTDYAGNLIIPIKNKDGMIIGFVTRFNEGDKRYKYNFGLRSNRYLFAVDKVIDKQLEYLYVTEGSLNAMWLWKFGYPAIALLGSEFDKTKIDLLKRISFSNLVILIDNDGAGVKLFNRLKREFKRFGVGVYYVLIPPAFSDIQDVRDEKLVHKLMESKRIED